MLYLFIIKWIMYLIIGLGNPGEEYENTRHNVGFLVLDKIAKSGRLVNGQDICQFKFDKSFNSETTKCKVFAKPSILAKPHTFVNNSGTAVKKLKLKYKVKSENIIIIHDDLDIDFGNIKLSFAKNSGGHNGVESIIKALKTNKFWRLRIGLAGRKLQIARRSKSKKDGINDVGKFVLSRFSPSEKDKFKLVTKKALQRLENLLR